MSEQSKTDPMPAEETRTTLTEIQTNGARWRRERDEARALLDEALEAIAEHRKDHPYFTAPNRRQAIPQERQRRDKALYEAASKLRSHLRRTET